MPEVLSAIRKEIMIHSQHKGIIKADTLYLGGGTPSLLGEVSLKELKKVVDENFDTTDIQEFTIEANPEDITDAFLQAVIEISCNRISLGIQSFHDPVLNWMNRSHTATDSLRAIKMCQDKDLHLSVDIIYGYPIFPTDVLLGDLEMIKNMGISHFSAYSLTIEPKTYFYKKGIHTYPDFETAQEETSLLLLDWIETNRYEQYEISNFCSEGNYGLHNSNYWKQVPYFGFGPSAHSYDGENRWNTVSNHQKYLAGIKQGVIPIEIDDREETSLYNEYIMTGLRTKWGILPEKVAKDFPNNIHHEFIKSTHALLTDGYLMFSGESLVLTRKGKLMLNFVLRELFFVED